MKRAILVSTGTVAGLVAVLTYSGNDQVPASASPTDALGAPPAGDAAAPSDGASPAPTGPAPTSPPASSAAATTTASPRASASAKASVTAASTTRASAPTTPAPSRAAPSPSKTSATPKPTPTPTRTTPNPRPTPTPTPSPTPTSVDYYGAAVTYRYGTFQVMIRVQGGVIISAKATQYPSGGTSGSINARAIPILSSETIQSQSASIANVSAATLSSNAWKTSLQSALSKAGL
ncbi:MAG TPA: hypothetical protein VFL59_09485 [Candidatus Nanopelagicales bacterium]|nr:hypothetical protein [Candidatus Nanopelagicales bacterium]